APGPAVRTTLDPAVQKIAELRLAEFFASPAPGRGRLTGAAVVIEAATGAVRALVGSPDYFDAARRGALNAALRPRSPGSALKPFLYALAFDRGAASPETCLWDVPLALGRYAPENYDRSYRGPVRAREALFLSLNVPAVELLRAVGAQSFLKLLRRAGLETLEPTAERYGLQLALGGCEVRLLELAAAYAALLRLGVPLGARVLEAELGSAPSPGGGRRILSPGACELVLECLSEDAHLRRALPAGSPGGSGFLAYKTGTSFGHRDAWAFALTSRSVVGVWIGDPGGRPDPDLVGAEAALPVALAIAGALIRESDPAPWETSGGPFVETAPVCAASGRPAGAACPGTVLERFPAGSPRPRPCEIHREILVERETGFEVCGGCRRGRETERRVVEVFPPEVEAWLSRSGVRPAGASRAPPHDPSCRYAAPEGSPRIVSPADGAVFRRSAEGARVIQLGAAPPPGATRLYWFVDGELAGTSPPLGGLPWPLEPGAHRVRCVD
ncbi:MAG: penicillin-binding transpeptidase domain-containing protein, partial [Planctomycetota bacterium]